MSAMLEKILSDENIKTAYKRVCANKGASGVDKVTTDELAKYMQENWSIDLTYRIKKINEVTRGWINYFRIGSMRNKIQRIDEHLRRMMRIIIWKQWKVSKKRAWGLTKLGINPWQAKLTAGIGDRYMIISNHPAVKKAISKEKLTKRGLISLSDYYLKVHI